MTWKHYRVVWSLTWRQWFKNNSNWFLSLTCMQKKSREYVFTAFILVLSILQAVDKNLSIHTRLALKNAMVRDHASFAAASS
jgi:hypothetical protein